MVARGMLLLTVLALASAGCASTRVSARRRPLPPPAGDRRVGAGDARGAGPAAVSAVRRPPAERSERPEVARAVAAASSLVGSRTVVVDGVDYGDGCAALVRAAYERAGRPLPPTARDPGAIHALAAARGVLKPGARAAPGDAVFLADRPGGPPAHVGIVARVDPDGTALVLHRVARGVMRMRVNLSHPNRTTDASGKRLNDVLVVGAAPVTAGSLVVAFAALL